MHSEKSEFVQVVLDFIGSPFRTIKLFVEDLSRIDDRLRDDSIGVRLLALAIMPFQLLGGFLSIMVQNWPTSRSGFAAILGLPAFCTLIGLLGAWTLADKFRSNTVRISTNQSYLSLNLKNFNATNNLARTARGLEKESLQDQAKEFAKSALVFGQKLVELDPEDLKLKYQLGTLQAGNDNIVAANDTMMSIAPDDEQGYVEAHLWRARFLARDKKADELKANLGLIEKHLAMATAADKDSLAGKAQLANTYMEYANLLEEKSEERLEFLEKADEVFREVITDETESKVNRSTKLNILRPSVLARKQLEALDPEKYSVDTEVDRVKNQITSLLKIAVRYYPDSLQLWELLINSAGEIRQFEFAVEIADQGIRVSETIETKQGLLRTKALTLRKAAVSINKFDDFEMYKKRFFYLCEAVRANPTDPINYILLLEFIGKENEKPDIQIARELGLAESGDAVPIKLDWLRRACLETKYTGVLNTMIGIHEFHLGDNQAAITSWTVAQQFTPSSRDFIGRVLEFHFVSKRDKLDNFEVMITEFLKVFPEMTRIRALRGAYYYDKKEFLKAIDDFQAALESNPKDLALHHRIKTCYQYLGRRSDANAEQDIIETKLKTLPEQQQQQLRKLFEKLDAKATAG